MKVIPTVRNNLASLWKQLNKVFPSFAINPVSWTETVHNKSCVSLCSDSFLYGSRGWKINKNKNNKANLGTFSQQWILPQLLLLLTWVGFKLCCSSQLRLKNKKVKKIIILCSILNYFVFPEKPFSWSGAKSQICPCRIHLLEKILWIRVSAFIFLDCIWMCLFLFLWQYTLTLYTFLFQQEKFTHLSVFWCLFHMKNLSPSVLLSFLPLPFSCFGYY